jgi:hypothetical protein
LGISSRLFAYNWPEKWASAKFRWRSAYGTYLRAALAMAWLALFQYTHPWIEIGHALLGWFLYGGLLFTLILLHGRTVVTALGEGTASIILQQRRGS